MRLRQFNARTPLESTNPLRRWWRRARARVSIPVSYLDLIFVRVNTRTIGRCCEYVHRVDAIAPSPRKVSGRSLRAQRDLGSPPPEEWWIFERLEKKAFRRVRKILLWLTLDATMRIFGCSPRRVLRAATHNEGVARQLDTSKSDAVNHC